MNSNQIKSKLHGAIQKIDFNTLCQTKENANPSQRIYDWMVLGPFVLETEGAFETEYLYERNKTLDEDYLKSSSFEGEASVIPYIGLECKNNYYGEETLTWCKGVNKWGALRFEKEGVDTVEEMYKTEQRNCVFYAAFYIECDEKKNAVICYEHSGGLLYLNGELIDNKPYGRVKGIQSMGNQVAVTFNEGLNLVMFKIRTGYICDTVDLSINNCAIYPVVAKCGNLGVAYPTQTAAYVGSVEKPRQLFPTFIGAFGDDSVKSNININAGDYHETHSIPAIKKGEVDSIRISVPVTDVVEKGILDVQIMVEQKQQSSISNIDFVLTQFNGFDGDEYVFSDFHFDTTYHQEQRVYALGAIYILKNIITRLREDKNFKAIISEVDYLHPYFSIYPEDRDFLKQMFIEGRAEADCFYNQPNEMTSSPEGLVRNMVYGQLYHRDVLGRKCHVYGPGDVFGHPNQLSQICAKGGCDGISWGKYIFGLDSLFRHVSPDGTSLIHNRGGITRSASTMLGIKTTQESADSNINSRVPAYPRDEKNSDWMNETLPKAKFAVPSDLITALKSDEKDFIIKTQEKDMVYNYTSRDIALYHAGVALTRMDLKQANRMGENLLITAEKLATIAAIYGAKYPEKALDKAWRQILCGQHHDSITGTNNEISFVDLMIEYREAVELAGDIVKKSAEYIVSAIKTVDTDNTKPYVVFNPHTWIRKEAVIVQLNIEKPLSNYVMVDEKGEYHPIQELSVQQNENGYSVKGVFTAEIPALGYRLYYLKETQTKTNETIVGNSQTIENEYYIVTIDRNVGGGIVSIFDKVEQREVINYGKDGPANRIVALKEIHDRMETLHEFYTTGHKLFSSDYTAQVVSQKGVEFEKLIVTSMLGTVAKTCQTITLYKGMQRIDFKTEIIDYQEDDDLFTVTFPVAVKGAKPIFDDRFAPQVRMESQRSLEFQTHQFFMYSRSHVYAANQWLDFGPSVKIEFTDKQQLKASINIGMTALICPQDYKLKNIADSLLMSLTKKAIPVTSYIDKDQQVPYGTRIVHFNQDLFNTDTRIVLSVSGIANEYEDKLLNEISDRKAQFDHILNQNKVAFIHLIDSDNEWNKPIDVVLIKAVSLDALEDVICSITKPLNEGGHTVNLPECICNNDVMTVDDYGVSILNTGNIACSVEKGGMLNLMLFHTAATYGNMGKTTHGEELVPERKTHVYTYALYPHSKSYREANVYRKGLELNDPLFVVDAKNIQKSELASLPECKGFVSTNEDVILTSMKATGYPLAVMKKDNKSIEERGITVRYFEPYGKNTIAKVDFGFDITSGASVDLLEEGTKPVSVKDNKISEEIKPYSIETVNLAINGEQNKLETKAIGAQKEAVEPTYIRSWEHDLGTMPMGYLAVVGAISRKPSFVDDVTLKLSISMANNRPDCNATGTMKLTYPTGWTLNLENIPYNVVAGGCNEYEVMVTLPCKGATGIIRLTYQDNGQVFEDIFEVGFHNPRMTIEIVGDKIITVVTNETSENLTGELAIASPVETWGTVGIDGLNPFELCAITPRTYKVQVNAGESKEYVFNIKGIDTEIFISFWAIGKLMINGRIHFAYTNRQDARHNYWSHQFIEDEGFKAGSLMPYLKSNMIGY